MGHSLTFNILYVKYILYIKNVYNELITLYDKKNLRNVTTMKGLSSDNVETNLTI